MKHFDAPHQIKFLSVLNMSYHLADHGNKSFRRLLVSQTGCLKAHQVLVVGKSIAQEHRKAPKLCAEHRKHTQLKRKGILVMHSVLPLGPRKEQNGRSGGGLVDGKGETETCLKEGRTGCW